jgi:hypothetical protein
MIGVGAHHPAPLHHCQPCVDVIQEDVAHLSPKPWAMMTVAVCFLTAPTIIGGDAILYNAANLLALMSCSRTSTDESLGRQRSDTHVPMRISVRVTVRMARLPFKLWRRLKLNEAVQVNWCLWSLVTRTRSFNGFCITLSHATIASQTMHRLPSSVQCRTPIHTSWF